MKVLLWLLKHSQTLVESVAQDERAFLNSLERSPGRRRVVVCLGFCVKLGAMLCP